MKKAFILSVVLTVLLLAVPAKAGETQQASQSSPAAKAPADIEQLFDGYARGLLKLSPETASYLGIGKGLGYDVSNDSWDDESPEGIEKLTNLKRETLRRLGEFDINRLTPSQRRAAGILRYALERDLVGEKFRDNFYLIGNSQDFHTSMTNIMAGYHTIESSEDARAYLSRLEKYAEKLRHISERLKTQAKNKQLPPGFIIEKFAGILSDFITTSPENNILAVAFRERLQGLAIAADVKENLNRDAEKKIETIVYPAYRAMSELLNQLAKGASDEAGVWRLPNGDEFYRYCLDIHTSSGMSPEQVYKLGLKEVRRIQQEIKRLIIKAGIQSDLSFHDLLNYFWGLEARINPSQLYYPNSRQGRIQALEDYQKQIDSINDHLPAFFSIFPKAKLLIKPIPWYMLDIMGPHYEAPSLDGKRPGAFYMNLSYPPFKPGMKTLAVHEGIPGHHFQISIARESGDIRLFRHLLSFTSYTEGWALYTEKLAMENGWYEDLYTQIGYLESELLRAVRLVLDTGLHYKHWTRDRALSYMRENMGKASSGEIDRYITWPGQACAYKTGELKILELRKRAQKELKNKFDIKEFHSVILKHGPVPLSILETYIDEYIKGKK